MRKILELKKRKPIIFLVCEGRNKTEKTYFNHFKTRDAEYNLYIKDCESSDIESMAKKAKNLFTENGLDAKLNDHVFCVVDLDLDKNKCNKLTALKQSKNYRNVEFIISNPCFEIWLLYYFTENPKIEKSSQDVKEQLKKYIPNYSENMDIIKEKGLEEKLDIPIKNSIYKNSLSKDKDIFDRNPYTEVQNLINILISYQKN